MAVLRPISRTIKAKEAKLAAGPAISNTKTVPGESPLSTKDNATSEGKDY